MNFKIQSYKIAFTVKNFEKIVDTSNNDSTLFYYENKVNVKIESYKRY